MSLSRDDVTLCHLSKCFLSSKCVPTPDRWWWLCHSTWQVSTDCVPASASWWGQSRGQSGSFLFGTQSSEGRALPFPNGCCEKKWAQHCEVTGKHVGGIHQEVTKAILEFQEIPFVHSCTGIWSKGWQPLLNAQTQRSCVLCHHEGTTPTKGNQKITCYLGHTSTFVIGLLTLCNYHVWK